MGNTYGYVRVSTREQNEDRQMAALNEMQVEEKNIYMDKQSGKDFDRPMYHRLLKRLKEGKIRPEEMISHRLPFDRLEEGFHIMRDKTEDYGKVMGKMEGLV